MDNRRTFTDQIQRLSLVHPVDEQQRALKLMRAAIRDVYKEFPLSHQWSCLNRSCLLYLQEPYTTGTVAISGTTVTLSGGTWPTWAGDGILLVGDERFQVIERQSGTVLRLDSRHSLGEALSGEYFELALARYSLPSDFGQLVGAYRTEAEVLLPAIYEREWSNAFAQFTETATPLYCQVVGVRGGALRLELTPAPSEAEYVRVDYRSVFRPFGTGRYATGTIAISGRTVTGTGTVFPTDAEGMVLRVGSANNEPTDLEGESPYTAAYTVARRVDDTSLILTEDATTVAAGAMFTLDDPIDIDPNSMLSAFDLAVEARFARLAQLDVRIDAETRADLAFRRAKAMDHRPNVPEYPSTAAPLIRWEGT